MVATRLGGMHRGSRVAVTLLWWKLCDLVAIEEAIAIAGYSDGAGCVLFLKIRN